MSVANQRVIRISKPSTPPPFVQVNQLDWQEAFKLLSPSAFGIYLYLAQNADGYIFEYSPQAIANTGLMAKGTASKAMTELINVGYVEDGVFYTSNPKRRAQRSQIQEEIKQTVGQS